MTNTWLIEVEFEDGEVFTHRTHKNPHDAGWECVFPTAVAVRFSPVPAQESQGASIPAPAEVGQGQGTKKEDPREKLKALRLQIEQKRLASTGFDNPDYVLVRASDLRRVALYLSVALDRSKYSIGRTQAVQARNELLRIQSCMVTLDDLLRKVREQGA